MPHILIADDEPRLAAFLEKGLVASGYATTTAYDGPTALQLARDDTFDLVLLDVGLPGIDGLGVLRELRRRGERLPVIIITAGDEIEGHGADDLLTKPFSFAKLLTHVRQQLE